MIAIYRPLAPLLLALLERQHQTAPPPATVSSPTIITTTRITGMINIIQTKEACSSVEKRLNNKPTIYHLPAWGLLAGTGNGRRSEFTLRKIYRYTSAIDRTLAFLPLLFLFKSVDCLVAKPWKLFLSAATRTRTRGNVGISGNGNGKSKYWVVL